MCIFAHRILKTRHNEKTYFFPNGPYGAGNDYECSKDSD